MSVQKPDIKILSVSNVYCRMMIFKRAGDQELGHYHSYDHGTFLSTGKIKVEMFDKQNNFVSEKVYEGPTFIFIKKDFTHTLTALEDNTTAICIHALRTIDEEIVSPEFLVDEMELADTKFNNPKNLKTIGEVMLDKGLLYKPLAH